MSVAPRPTRRAPLILPFLALPALIGCGGEPTLPPAPAAEATAAVAARPGAPREALIRAVDRLFSDTAAGDTNALIVMHGGRIVAERYAEPYGQDTRFLGWSMTKCVTGLMIGQLVADGRLRLDETAPVPAWQRPGDPRGEITLRQLLQMRSGLRHAESAEPRYASDTVRMLYLDGRDDMASYAEAQPLEAEPGRRFEYSTATSVILADLAARTLTESRDPSVRRQTVADYLRNRLFEPVGMHSMQPEFDSAGTFIGGTMLHGTARDWAKLGEMLRNGGAVAGAQIVPRGWVALMTRPSPREAAYGIQLWLNRARTEGEDVLFPDRAPSSLFACVGHLGQYVIVSPAQRLTVVRLGKTDDAARDALRGQLADLVELFPVQK
jgi:CubicO group peptidase (beta-lactamase class C family)